MNTSIFKHRAITPSRRQFLIGASSLVVAPNIARGATGPVKIGITLPLSGLFADQGLQCFNGIKLFQKVRGTTAAGRPVETIIKDDQGAGGDLARRLMVEMVSNDRVDFLAGFSFTQNALGAVSLINEAKKPAVIMNAATSIITERSPYFVRVSWTLPQSASILATWAAKAGLKKVFSVVSDYAPGVDAETSFKTAFAAGGGEMVGSLRTPMSSLEYAPFLLRVKEAKPDAVFAFLPGGDVASSFMKSFKEKGLPEDGIKLLCTGDVVEDQALPVLGSAADGTISAHHYSTTHDSPENKAFLKAHLDMFGPATRPNFRAVQGYDGMAAIYQALEGTQGDTDPDKIMSQFKGMRLTSARGPIYIEPSTRDITQTVYIRKTEQRGGEWNNYEIAAFPDVKDPGK